MHTSGQERTSKTRLKERSKERLVNPINWDENQPAHQKVQAVN